MEWINWLFAWTLHLAQQLAERVDWSLSAFANSPHAVWAALMYLLLIAVILFVLLLFIWQEKKNLAFERDMREDAVRMGFKMTKQEREDYLDKVMADAIVDGIEEAHFHGLITREEALKIFRKLAVEYNLRDLVLRTEQVRVTKAQIQRRRNMLKGHPSKVAPVVFPGDPPPQSTSTVRTAKNRLDALLFGGVTAADKALLKRM